VSVSARGVVGPVCKDEREGGKGHAMDARTMVPAALVLAGVAWAAAVASAAAAPQACTYRRFTVQEVDGHVVATTPQPEVTPPRWARDVSQEPADWSGGPDADGPFFKNPIPFVIPPKDDGEPFYRHNHQPAITWCASGDLLAIWYSTVSESGTEMTVLASRLRRGRDAWDPSSEFFKAAHRNMTGSSLLHDGKGTLYHFNGMGPKGAKGWGKLALLMRRSTDNGVTWTPARPISSGEEYARRHQVIAGTLMTEGGTLVQPCDATPGGQGATAIHVSRDGGKTWSDPGGGIRGIHAGVAELADGRLLAFGRGRAIDGRMPMSLSADMGRTWTSKASPFPPIGSGQRLVLKRLREGPLLFASFSSGDRRKPEAGRMTVIGPDGKKVIGHGLFAAVSFDDGRSWPVRRLLAARPGEYNGGAHTGRFTATTTRAEHGGYLAVTQTPDGVIHLISSRLHYRFNLAWLLEGGATADGAVPESFRHRMR